VQNPFSFCHVLYRLVFVNVLEAGKSIWGLEKSVTAFLTELEVVF
jgi:hypothetical protein